jgi:hypothetical protein
LKPWGLLSMGGRSQGPLHENLVERVDCHVAAPLASPVSPMMPAR